MKTIFSIAMVGAAISLNAQNLIKNGDFSSSSIETQYQIERIDKDGSTSLLQEGSVAVKANTKEVHDLFVPTTDRSGNGKMLIVNGATQENLVVWSQTVNVAPNTTYQFALWAKSVFSRKGAVLEILINGENITNAVKLGNNTKDWTQVLSNWNSGNSTKATISIKNKNIVGIGNDFVIDDIEFSGTLPSKPNTPQNIEKNLTVKQETAGNGMALNLFPNPTTDMVTVNVSLEKATSFHVNILDINGKTVKSSKVPSTASFSENYNLQNLAPGIYFVQTILPNQILTEKLVIN
jgi:hypothetical protein